MAPTSALAAVGDLTFMGCVGALAGCTATAPSNAVDGPVSVAVSPDASSVYAASRSSNAIDEFSRNAATGALTFIGCVGDAPCTTPPVPFPPGAVSEPSSVVLSADGKSVYAGSYGSNLIDEFSRNPSTGALTFTGCIGNDTGCTEISGTYPEGLPSPQSLALSADGSSVYVGSDNNEVDVLSRNTTTGALAFTGCVGSDTGCTAPPKPFPENAVDEVNSVAVSADGNSVYAGSVNTAVITEFARNTTTGALTFTGCIGKDAPCATPPPSLPANAVDGPQSLALSADGRSVYAASEYSDVIDVFSRDTTSGELTLTGCIGDDSPCTTTSPSDAADGPRSVALSADGSSVYAASGFADVIDVFSRDTTTGELTLTGCIGEDSSCTTTSPSHAVDDPHSVAVSADGSSVYAASESNAIDVFSRQVPPVVCTNISGGVTFDTPTTLTLSCSDADPVQLAFAINSNPAHGTLGPISPSGQVTYTPASGYSGPDSFGFMASDSQGSSSMATATLTIAAPPLAPLSPPPPLPLVTRATFDDQRITLTTPSPLECTMPGGKLGVTLASATIPGAKAAKLRFSSAAFYLDKGVKHTHKKTIHTRNGKKKTVIVTTYSPNATAHHIPVTLELSTTGLKAGTHTLTVKLSYKETKTKHGHKTTVTVTKTVTAKFTVC